MFTSLPLIAQENVDLTHRAYCPGSPQFKAAVVTVFGLDNPELVKVDESVRKCTVDSWQRRVSIYNEEDETGSAADIASAQVDKIYPNSPTPKTTEFFEEISAAVNAEDSAVRRKEWRLRRICSAHRNVSRGILKFEIRNAFIRIKIERPF